MILPNDHELSIRPAGLGYGHKRLRLNWHRESEPNRVSILISYGTLVHSRVLKFRRNDSGLITTKLVDHEIDAFLKKYGGQLHLLVDIEFKAIKVYLNALAVRLSPLGG